jgi:hypothetical protein
MQNLLPTPRRLRITAGARNTPKHLSVKRAASKHTFGRSVFREKPYMKRICSWSLGGIVIVCGQLVWGDMYLQGSGGDHAMSATHDRYYNGTDKAFIGASLDFSGVSSGPP